MCGRPRSGFEPVKDPSSEQREPRRGPVFLFRPLWTTNTPCNIERMSAQDFAIAIMAAGKGTRLKSKRPKVLHEVGGKPLLAHVIAAAVQVVPPENIYVIIGHQAERVRTAVAGAGVHFVLQAE